jgi:hypothetical protein
VVEPLQVLNLLLSFPFFFSMVIKKLLYQASKTKGVLKLMKDDVLMISEILDKLIKQTQEQAK